MPFVFSFLALRIGALMMHIKTQDRTEQKTNGSRLKKRKIEQKAKRKKQNAKNKKQKAKSKISVTRYLGRIPYETLKFPVREGRARFLCAGTLKIIDR